MWWVSAARAGLSLGEPPALGDEVTATLTAEDGSAVVGATVRVVYRPGLADSTEVAVGVTDARGQVAWVPDQQGTALLIANDTTLPVAIPWAQAPLGTIVILLMVLMLGLGSIGYGLRPTTR